MNEEPAAAADADKDSAKALRQMLHASAERHRAGDLAAAERGYRAVLAQTPHDPDALHLLGLIEQAKGDFAASERLIREGLALRPADANMYNSLAVTLMHVQAYGAAQAALSDGLKRSPKSADLLYNMGQLAHHTGRLEEAKTWYRRALAIAPDHASGLNNLGSLLMEDGAFEEAEALFACAVSAAPAQALGHLNLGRVFRHLQRLDPARRAFESAIGIDPNNAEAHFGLAMCQLLAGDYGTGLATYEWRYALPDNPPRHADRPVWDGGPLNGRSILLWTEQGFGDAIQFARFVPRVAAAGPGRVILECPKPLIRLFEKLPGVDAVVERGTPPPPTDLQTPVMRLAHLFGASLDTLPGGMPYLTAPKRPALPDHPGSGPKIGLVLGTQSRMPGSGNKSLDPMAAERLATALPGRKYNLQLDIDEALLGRMTAAGVADLRPLIGDFADTASLMGQLDLIVSVDTAAAHLAGALGRPVWVLLNASRDWRWLLDRHDSPWYPSARLFRQDRAKDWEPVVDAVLGAVRQ